MAASEKALCIMALALGDSVCVLPELRFLAEKHGRPVDVLIKKRPLVSLYDGVDFVGQVFQVKQWNFFPLLLLRVGPLLKREKYSHIYFLNGKTHVRKFLKVLSLVDHVPCQITAGFPEDIRAISMCLKSVFPAAFKPPALVTTDGELDEMRRELREAYGWNGEPLILFHPGSSHSEGRRSHTDNSREWPVEKWRETMAGIRALVPDAMFVVSGTKNECGLAEAILHGASGKAVSLAGRLSLRRLLSLQTLAHSCVSTDTGAAHTAMAVGCPTVILYDECDPRDMGRCSPKGWGAAITIRGFRNGADSRKAAIRNILPKTVIRLFGELPPRSPEPSSEHFISHYCEGDMEPEVLPVLYQ